MTSSDGTDWGFGVDHLPYGSFSEAGERRLGVRLGDRVLDAAAASRQGLLPEACDGPDLDRLLAAGAAAWAEVRSTLISLITMSAVDLEPMMYDLSEVTLHLPFTVADYVDFYSSEAHATNLGSLFRPDQPPLLPNWKYLPVGYHGRSGTVVVSGTEIARPSGQRRETDGTITVGPSRKLDIELEMGVVLGGATRVGEPVSIDEASDHIFGLALLNDWSARDIQAWEYVPLGPFLGKSFATSLAAWITPIAALDQHRVAGPEQVDPVPFAYLRTDQPWGFDIELQVLLRTEQMRDTEAELVVLSTTNYRDMYWTMAQQFAHMTVNGASIRSGDLFGSGTISGWKDGEEGSLLEITRNGQNHIVLPDGAARSFLEPDDEVVIRGFTGSIRLAEVRGRIEG